jgi:hypothetical protein
MTNPATEQHHRLPRFRRTDVPPVFKLTSRDKEIIRWIYRCRYLTLRQVSRLPSSDARRPHLFPPTTHSNVNKRLRLLFHHGYLWRISRPVAFGSSEIVYCLDTKGRDLIARELGVGRRQVRWKRYSDTSNELLFLDHTLAINDLRLNIEVAVRQGGHRLMEWIDERTLKSRTMKDYVDEPGQDRKMAIVPDGYFTLEISPHIVARFFLEVDRGRQEQKAFRRKIRGYLQYVNSGGYYERYHSHSLRVLIVNTVGARCLANLKHWTEKEASADLFWFSTLEQTEPGSLLNQPVWWVAGKNQKYPLLPAVVDKSAKDIMEPWINENQQPLKLLLDNNMKP